MYLGNGVNSGLDRYADETFDTFNNTADSFAYPFDGNPLGVGDFKKTAVNYDVPGFDAANPNGEWLEITNTGSSAADLRDLRIQYQIGTFLNVDESFVVDAGDTIRVLDLAEQVGDDVVFDFGSDGMLTVENATIAMMGNDLEMV